MPFSILQPDIQEFIKANETEPVLQLALKKNPFPDTDWSEILAQIEGRQKSKGKLPTWYAAANIVYPTRISLEQTSSERTAAYKAKLIGGQSIIDLSGGLGVDAYYFSEHFESVIHCEADENLSAIATHNLRMLGRNNIKCIAGDSMKTLKELSTQFDWIYVDPSRRNDQKGKVFMLKDCTPNVPDLLDFYFRFSGNILIKTAPILDISAGLRELRFVSKVHIIAVDNEVKELLWEIKNGYASEIQVTASNLKKDSEELFSFRLDGSDEPSFSKHKTYLYEPNSAIMKSGGFGALGQQFGLDKLHPHSHLYTSEKVISFPGRVFRILKQLPYQKKEMKEWLTGKKANITVRHFPDSVATIRKKWRIADGGDLYCFFTTDSSNVKIVLLCEKLSG